jgi:hypothetical protein
MLSAHTAAGTIQPTAVSALAPGTAATSSCIIVHINSIFILPQSMPE